MRIRRVVVVGASGFVGRYVVKHLAGTGAVIAAVSRHASGAGFLRPMGDVGQVALIDCDIRDRARLRSLLDGADAVVNAVGILYERGAQKFRDLHDEAPGALAALAAEAGVRRFVHVSALGAAEDAPASYARSKARGESAVRAAFPAATVLRPSLVFGPEDSFFNRFAAIARLAPALPLIGGGTTRFAPVYVGDVAAAAAAALARGDAAGRLYELGGPRVCTLKELFELLLKEIGRKRLLVHLPFGLAFVAAMFLERAPNPLLTRDQLRLLRRDAVPEDGTPGLADLGVEPVALELVLPGYLARFRPGGKLSGAGA